MEHNTTRNRVKDGRSMHSPARHIRNKSSAQAQSLTPPTTASSHTRTLQSEQLKAPQGRKSVDDDRIHFIGNVGAGGTLYLRPSRLPHHVTVLPATPPDTAYGEEPRSNQSKTSSARSKARGPPISLANSYRRRERPHSTSTLDAGTGAGAARDTDDGDLLDLYIPNYKLGTPRFSARGTAYLRDSDYTTSTEDRSSIMSQDVYDRLFPIPPQRSSIATVKALSTAKQSQSFKPASAEVIFDRLEVNPNDPSSILYGQNGQLLAATIPRLIVQITSPAFLDYELLSDFFLTYRSFLESHELLNWLMSRMRWALQNVSDSGRIVRVRTFVAMRHWILNYFADDFATSLDLRLQFCQEVNLLARELIQQGGIGDLNIIGELKKCWRRTSALFWSNSDAMSTSVIEDIRPGGEMPDTLRVREDHILRNSQLIAIDQRTNQRAKVVSLMGAGAGAGASLPASLPTSPMSEDSLQVLSCSIPFLQRIRPDSKAELRAYRSAAKPVLPQRRNSLAGQDDARHSHRRAESDTILVKRPSTSYADNFDTISSLALSGGLVRGLLLQPPPAHIRRNAPRSPYVDLDQTSEYFEDHSTSHSVKKIVGDVKRALSVRRGNGGSISKSTHSDTPTKQTDGKDNMDASARIDLLAARAQESYRKHFMESMEVETTMLDELPRLMSGITTGSRSIVIVDATSIPKSQESPEQHKYTNEQLTMMPLFPGIMDVQRASSSPGHREQIPIPMQEDDLHQSFVFPPPSDRKSSSIHAQLVDVKPPRLRRRPGGDLKAADHVHELTSRDALASSITSITSDAQSVLGTKQSLTTDRSSLQPHVRPSFRSDAGRLARVRSGSEGGGVEDALARLEGKSSMSRPPSDMSWFKLPTKDDSKEPNQGTTFQIIHPSTKSEQIYHLSKADSLAESPIQHSFANQVDRASSPPVNFDPNDVYIAGSKSDARESTIFTGKSSFLLDDNQSLSDVPIEVTEGEDNITSTRSFFFDDARTGEIDEQPRPITPAHLSQRRVAASAAKTLGIPTGSLIDDVLHSTPQQRLYKSHEQGHHSAVLAFESSVIAEQLCIIEKDALDEVDWKDLITLNWHHSPSRSRDWAEYLKEETSNGIDLVVTRFNLMVKWVVSQCILTESTIDRAYCMTKFIHIAAHCLHLRNYASMAQITLALLSSDLARLQKTWMLIPPAERKTLNRLEFLCQPLRNFHNLRAEMESSSLTDGCIPFIGLYTHDLMYNAQKPALLSTPTTSLDDPPTLINFERYQTAASVTKSLLRLLDASARYVFRPHPEALSRCLWLAALEDSDISQLSMHLE